MLEPFLKKMRERIYRAGLESRSRAGKFKLDTLKTTVGVPTEYLTFISETRAQEWAQQHNAHYIATSKHATLEPDTMRWLIGQRSKGIDIGTLHDRIMHASLENFDDMLAWFVREPDPASAFELLKFGFAADRPDVTQAIADWATKHPSDWFDPRTLIGPNKDANGERFQQTHSVCLFGMLLPQAHLMAWLFEHEIGMKHRIQNPLHWNALLQKMQELDPMRVAYWPAAAHHAFRVAVDPLQPNWPVECFGFLCRALPAYAHDPAAQSYFVHQFVGKPVTDLLVEHAGPEVIEMHHRVQLAADSNHKRPDSTPPYDCEKVEALMLGIHLGLDHQEFYYHAKNVFGHSHALPQKAPTQYADLDASIF